MSTHVETLKVRSGQGDYDVEFPPLVASVARGLSRIPKAVLVIDRKVAALHREGLAPVLSTLPVLELDATEDEKTLRGVEKVCAWLQTLGGTKQTTLITVGGGIIQDIACFAAHTFSTPRRVFSSSVASSSRTGSVDRTGASPSR